MLVAEEVHRVVLRDADERESESEGDAVNRARQRADRCEAGEARTCERQQAEYKQAQAAIRDQQQNHHADRRKSSEPLGLCLGALLHEHREGAGSADREPKRRLGADRLKRCHKDVGGFALRLRIKAGGYCFGD
jgi:hypothetical protein